MAAASASATALGIYSWLSQLCSGLGQAFRGPGRAVVGFTKALAHSFVSGALFFPENYSYSLQFPLNGAA